MSLDHRLGRRDLVRLGASVTAGVVVAPALSACGVTREETGADTASAAAPDDADITLLTAAIHDEARLLGLAVATLRAHPDLVVGAQALVTRQREHVRRLTSSLSEAPEVRRGRPPSIPRKASAAITGLRDETSAAEQSRLDDCLAATSGLLARLFASMSASHAVTTETLRGRR